MLSGQAHLQHLDERDSQVQVDDIAEMEREGHEQADGHNSGHVEGKRDGLLCFNQLEDLRATCLTWLDRRNHCLMAGQAVVLGRVSHTIRAHFETIPGLRTPHHLIIGQATLAGIYGRPCV